MPHSSYYDDSIQEFLSRSLDEIMGIMAQKHGHELTHEQKYAWREQIHALKKYLNPTLAGHVFFEFSIPRMGKRADVIILINDVVVVLEFKIGATNFSRSAIDQVHDYALDLKNFHRGSHDLKILPILVLSDPASVSSRKSRQLEIAWSHDNVALPICIYVPELCVFLDMIVKSSESAYVDSVEWASSGYHPTPSIIEAALALYRQHDVREITRAEAGVHNLAFTKQRVEEIIEDAKKRFRKAICFITGVPGAGKTLAGLDIATSRAAHYSDEHAVFLSGNGPLVEVLRAALARDEALRKGVSQKEALRRVSSFVQNIHHFRDAMLINQEPPAEKVVVFDEAQRAWNQDMASKFMQRKRGYASFNMSEPAFLLSVMNRHSDWCTVICLVGGGQEINTGEAGLAEWIRVVRSSYPDWDLYVSNDLNGMDYIWDKTLANELCHLPTEPALHLAVSVRSFRAEALSEFVGLLLDNQPGKARSVYSSIAHKYPILLTRSLDSARSWLRSKARGSERFGLIASSGAARLRTHGVWMASKVNAPTWFLNAKEDVRSSFYLEEVASEFDIQGLELDWVGVCWDADLRWEHGAWQQHRFRGTQWQRVNNKQDQLYLKNAYRVLLTRARQGLVIFVPEGDLRDPTRNPEVYNAIAEYLTSCGIPILQSH